MVAWSENGNSECLGRDKELKWGDRIRNPQMASPSEARKPPLRSTPGQSRGPSGGRARASPALHLLLQLLHLVANLSSHGARLPHFGEQSCHLVAAQEASGTAS